MNLPLGHLNFISYSDTSETVQIWKYFGNVEKFIDEFNDAKNSGHLSKDFPIDLNLSVKEAMASPRLICHRTKMNWSPQFVMKGFQLRGAWARSVQAYFDWISFVPEIAKLSEHDKVCFSVVLHKNSDFSGVVDSWQRHHFCLDFVYTSVSSSSSSWNFIYWGMLLSKRQEYVGSHRH